MLVYFPERYKTKRICDKVAEDYQAALNLFLIGFSQVKCTKNLIILYTLMMVYSFIMKILIKSQLLLFLL